MKSSGSCLCLLAVLALAACDDPKSAAKTAPSAKASATAAVPSAPPTVTASASAAPAIKVARDIKCSNDEVKFSIPQLEQDIRRKISKDSGPVTKADLAKVKSINLSQAKTDFVDPCVFPFLTNAKDIFFGPGKLDDLKGIEGLTQLVSLRASNCEVKDIKPIARMTKLDRLDLAHTLVEDISPIGNMPELTELSLDDTLVVDVSPLAKCAKLERLSLRNTRVKDLKPLLGLTKLKTLSVQGSPITDTNVLAPLKAKGLKDRDDVTTNGSFHAELMHGLRCIPGIPEACSGLAKSR